jgi:hypothetical protein
VHLFLRRIVIERPSARALLRGAACLAGAGLLALLAGCSWFGSSDKDKASCPTTYVAPDLDALTLMRPGGTGVEDIRFGVKVYSATSTCSGDKSGVQAQTDLLFVVARNDPDLKQGQFTYFVAIADGQQNILSKQDFTLQVEFAARQNQVRISEALKETLPLRNPKTGSYYSIIVGLQLTPEQLEFNRKRGQTP